MNDSQVQEATAHGPYLAHCLFLYDPGFYIFTFLMVEKKIKRTSHDMRNDVSFGFVHPRIKFYWGTAMLIWLGIVCGSVHAVLAELSRCNRDHTAPKLKSN